MHQSQVMQMLRGSFHGASQDLLAQIAGDFIGQGRDPLEAQVKAQAEAQVAPLSRHRRGSKVKPKLKLVKLVA